MDDTNNTNQTPVVSDQSSDEVTAPQIEEVAPAEESTDSNLDVSGETSETTMKTDGIESSEPSEDSRQVGITEEVEEKPETVSTESANEEKSETEEAQDSGSVDNEEGTEIVDTTNQHPNARWYVVHTYSGHENKVATTLKQKVETERLEDRIIDVLVPVQDKIEIKNGKKATIKEKIFPGYILVKMVLDDASWLAVRTTQGVTSFVGIGNKPTPISEKEVQTIVAFTKNTEPVYKQVFAVSDTVKIVEGPFAEFIGKIDSVDEERGKVRVLVSIFGRETPVELDFLQIQKI